MSYKEMIYKIYRRIARFLGRSGLGKIDWLWHFNNSLRKRLRPEFVIRNGKRFYLDSLDSHNLSLRYDYEPESTEIIRRVIRKHDTCIDVGANIGYYTDLFSRLANCGRIYSFEPNEETFQILRKNCDVFNVKLYNCAVGESVGDVKFYYSEDSTRDSIFSRPDRKKEKMVKVQMIALDRFGFAKVDFLKIDVEGAELDVLRGSRNLLQDNPDIKLLVECHLRTAPGLFSFLQLHKFNVTFLDRHETYCNLYCERSATR